MECGMRATALLIMMTVFSSSVTAKVRMSMREGTQQLLQFIKNGQTAVAITFIESHPDPIRLVHSGYYSSTPLEYAARYGNLDLVKYLIEEMSMEVDYADTGQGISKGYYSGNTALHKAAIHNRIEVARYLLDKGADLHREGKKRADFTPLHYAASYGSLATAELLVERGADVNAAVQAKFSKRVGITPLHLAVEDDNNLPMVDFLLAKGANVDQPDSYGYTPLSYAEGHRNYYRGKSYEDEPKGGHNNNVYKRDGRM